MPVLFGVLNTKAIFIKSTVYMTGSQVPKNVIVVFSENTNDLIKLKSAIDQVVQQDQILYCIRL